MVSDLLSRKISELTALYEVSKTLASSLDLKHTANEIFGILHEKLDLRRGTLFLKNPEDESLSILAAHGLSAEEISRGRYRKGEGITGLVLEKGQPMVIPDIGREPRFLNRTKSRGDIKRQNIAFLCVPIKVQGATLGVLSADRIFGGDDVPLEEDVRFLTVLASLIGQAARVSRQVESEKSALREENVKLQGELHTRYQLASVVGDSKKMSEVYELVHRAADAKTTVLLRGETGTGKELIARALHYNSRRADKPFIRVSCAALPETLLESELFGHEKGAFTGALAAKAGRFELADGGTLFLDEIGEISLAIQVKLLRVLQDRRFERLGGSKTLSVDVRVIAATNRDLEAALKQKQFREDLYYRLNVIPIFLPPLRDRGEDIPLLIEHFLAKFNAENNKEAVFSRPAMEAMLRYSWPGNVRELENCVERAVVLANRKKVELDDLPLAVKDNLPFSDAASAGPGPATLPGTVKEMEKDRIQEALRRHGGVQARAARELGLSNRQMGYKLKKYSISTEPK